MPVVAAALCAMAKRIRKIPLRQVKFVFVAVEIQVAVVSEPSSFRPRKEVWVYTAGVSMPYGTPAFSRSPGSQPVFLPSSTSSIAR